MLGLRGRRRLGCRRREMVAMMTMGGVLLLLLYTLALSWCMTLPPWTHHDQADAGLGAESPPARKLQFQPFQKADSGSPVEVVAAAASSSSLSSSSSSSSSSSLSFFSALASSVNRAAGRMGGGQGEGPVQRHHRTLQFSNNVKDGLGGVEYMGGYYANSVHSDPTAMGRGSGGAYPSSDLGLQSQAHRDRDISAGLSEHSPFYLDDRSGDRELAAMGRSSQVQDYQSDSQSAQAGVPRGISSSSSSSGNRGNVSEDASGVRRLPGAIIIGVKKAGTRALLEFLRIHPDVQAPGPEPHFFDRNYKRGLDWYRSLMPMSRAGQLTMEKTPSYFITREVPGRVRAMSPGTKLLVVVRDPVTRAVSDYVQAASKRGQGQGRMKRFEDMALLDQRLGIVNTSWPAIRIGVYAKHLQRWLQHFPRDRIHLVSGEQLIRDPAQVLRDVQAFLGLRPFIGPEHFYLNATRGFPCLVKHPERSSKPHCLGNTKGRAHPDVSPRVVERLRDFYRPFNHKFYRMVGIDFGWS